MSTNSTEQQSPEQNNRSPKPKAWLILIAVVALFAIVLGAFAGASFIKRRAFVALAGSACREAAQLDYSFGGLMDSPAPPRDQVLKDSSDAAKRIGELEKQLEGASAPGDLRSVQASLCQALDQHQYLYAAISSQASGGLDLTEVRKSVEATSELYRLVDDKKLPLVSVLPALTADRVVMGLTNMIKPGSAKAPQPEAPAAQPPPTVTVKPPAQEPPPPSVAAEPPKQPTAPSVAVKPPKPPTPPSVAVKSPRLVPITPKRKPAVAKKHKSVSKPSTRAYRCPYRGCNAWFIKASLLQKHKKYCIYRPGGPVARSRKR